jgi:hypothetical protein
MRGNSPVRFGKGPTEKDPSHGHLAGGLFHSGRGRRKRTRTAGTSPAAYFTLRRRWAQQCAHRYPTLTNPPASENGP